MRLALPAFGRLGAWGLAPLAIWSLAPLAASATELATPHFYTPLLAPVLTPMPDWDAASPACVLMALTIAPSGQLQQADVVLAQAGSLAQQASVQAAVQGWRFKPLAQALQITVAFASPSADCPLPRIVRGTDLPSADAEARAHALVPPYFPPQQLASRSPGCVQLGFVINAAGRASQLHVLQNQGGPLFSEAVLWAAKQWRFTPAPGPQRLSFGFGFGAEVSGDCRQPLSPLAPLAPLLGEGPT